MELPVFDEGNQDGADATATAERTARKQPPARGKRPAQDGGDATATSEAAGAPAGDTTTEGEEAPDTDRRGRPKKDVDQRLRHRLTVRLNDGQQERLEQIATDRDETPSETMRHLIAAEEVDDRAAQLRTVRRQLAELGQQVREKADEWISEANDREGIERRQEEVLELIYDELNRLMPNR